MESLDDFTYRFIELAQGMGLGEDQRSGSFHCCLPGNLHLYIQGCDTIVASLDKLKIGIALGVCLGNIVEKSAAAVPFMMTSDKSVNFSNDTIANEGFKKVKYTIKQNNKENLDKTDRMAAPFEKFGQNRDSRYRNRSSERYNNKRGSKYRDYLSRQVVFHLAIDISLLKSQTGMRKTVVFGKNQFLMKTMIFDKLLFWAENHSF